MYLIDRIPDEDRWSLTGSFRLKSFVDWLLSHSSRCCGEPSPQCPPIALLNLQCQMPCLVLTCKRFSSPHSLPAPVQILPVSLPFRPLVAFGCSDFYSRRPVLTKDHIIHLSTQMSERTIHWRHLWQDPIYLVVAVTSNIFQFLFIHLPDFLVRHVPNSGSILSMLALYIFAQTLALLWGFLAVAIAVGSSNALQALDSTTPCLAPKCITTDAHMPQLFIWRLVQLGARLYQHYASLSVWWFLSRSLFELGMRVPLASTFRRW
jgi:hypothetical protein